LLVKNKNVSPCEKVVTSNITDIALHNLGWARAEHERNKTTPPMNTAMIEKALAVFHLASADKPMSVPAYPLQDLSGSL
jgi:hypothetical protein